MELPDTLWTALKLVGGFALFVLGVSFAWKFINAAFSGKVEYWAGFENYGNGMMGFVMSGGVFSLITLFISPLLCHLPYNKNNSLIKTRQTLWVHLFFGPVFFVLALMCMTSGADAMGIPASNSLNYVLTLGRWDIPPCIVYSPPGDRQFIGTYRFPFVKKATKKILRFLCTTIPENKKDSYNAYEANGNDVKKYTKTGNSWIDDDDEDDMPKPVVPATAVTTTTRKK